MMVLFYAVTLFYRIHLSCLAPQPCLCQGARLLIRSASVYLVSRYACKGRDTSPILYHRWRV